MFITARTRVGRIFLLSLGIHAVRWAFLDKRLLFIISGAGQLLGPLLVDLLAHGVAGFSLNLGFVGSRARGAAEPLFVLLFDGVLGPFDDAALGLVLAGAGLVLGAVPVSSPAHGPALLHVLGNVSDSVTDDAGV